MNKFWTVLTGLGMSAFLFAEPQKEFRTYVSLERVSDGTQVEISLPDAKTDVTAKVGQKLEIPYALAKTGRVLIVAQMKNDKHKMLPCNIYVEQLSDYDRRYICHTETANPTAVEVRVYTNLHGGEMKSTPMLAKK